MGAKDEQSSVQGTERRRMKRQNDGKEERRQKGEGEYERGKGSVARRRKREGINTTLCGQAVHLQVYEWGK